MARAKKRRNLQAELRRQQALYPPKGVPEDYLYAAPGFHDIQGMPYGSKVPAVRRARQIADFPPPDQWYGQTLAGKVNILKRENQLLQQVANRRQAAQTKGKKTMIGGTQQVPGSIHNTRQSGYMGPARPVATTRAASPPAKKKAIPTPAQTRGRQIAR